uniref:Stress-activated map kinase-interacting protein 1 n=2 Tax=Cacopsylla melanoneura TaxID=428564 RepID=A0A8D8YXE3_9HEMI
MALYDNQHWLLSHIRNSFISSDDTGMCEVVMMSENIPQQMIQTKYSIYPGLGESDEEDDLDMLSQSIDIHSDLQYGLLRHRSNTASKLEKMEQARKKAAQIRIVKWRRNQTDNSLDDNVLNELFKKKDISSMKCFENQSSLLTHQLQKFPHFPKNPYQMYAKYDGNAQVGLSTRKYKIFLHMLPPEQRNYPMEVVIVVGTRVLDLIGLTLWKCFIEYSTIKLKDIEFYSLYIAEDDGEVDCDLPSFEVSEFIAKFGFGYLALIEKEIPLSKNKFQVNTDIQPPVKPKIELIDQIETAKKLPDGNGSDKVLIHNPWHNLEAPLYQSYRVYMLNKFRTKSEILLGVSGEKIEIDPVINNKTGSRYIWNKQKAVTYDIDAIVACDLTQNKSNKATFRLVYDQSSVLSNVDSCVYGSLGTTLSNHNYKHYDFEVEYRVADEIVQKINHILDLRSNPKRKDYLAIREDKSHRRKSFTFGPR